MSSEERIYTINLGKVLLSPNNIRAKRAINMIKEFGQRHMKTDDIRMDADVSHHIWSRGIRHPPRKIRVGMERTDTGYVRVYLYDERDIDTKEIEVKEKVAAVEAESPSAAVSSDALKKLKEPAPGEEPTADKAEATPAPGEEPAADKAEATPAPGEEPAAKTTSKFKDPAEKSD